MKKNIDTDRIPAAAFDKMKTKAEDRSDPINNTEIVELFRATGGRLFHALPNGKRRGVTFAYVVKNSRIMIATGVQHRHDTFTKKVGTKKAIEHFFAGKMINLPLGKDTHVTTMLSLLTRVFQ